MQAPVWQEDFYGDAFIRDPIPRYAAMREMGDVVWLQEQNVFALTSYDAVVSALRSPDVFQSGKGLSLNDEVNARLLGSTLNSDGELHDRRRSVTSVPIMPKNLERFDAFLAKRAAEIADNLIAQRNFDAVRDFAQPLPMTFVTELIGLNDAGRESMLKWASATFNLFEGYNARSRSAFPDLVELRAFLDENGRPEALAEGGLARRIFDVAPGCGFSFEEAQQLMRDYISPSLDTTISALGFAAYYFARFPEEWDRLCAEPDLIPNAVEEAARLATPIRAFSRYVGKTTEIAGIAIPKGSRAILIYASANRDARVWDAPDTFKADRNVRKHLGFGHGRHACMGMHLARREMAALIRAMADRVQRWELDGTPDIAMNNTIRAFANLPMRVL